MCKILLSVPQVKPETAHVLLILSPLVALMMNQIDSITSRGLSAIKLDNDLSNDQIIGKGYCNAGKVISPNCLYSTSDI